MQKIKKIKRIGILETNSSSSHSLCISTDGSLCKPGDGCWDIELSEDGKTAYLPKFQTCFNQQNFKTNHCSTKAQYAYAAALQRNPKKQLEITEIIKKITGAEEVIIGWVEAYKEEINKIGHSLSMAEFYVPSIDHDSVYDAFIQIFESEETLKNFIFNPQSWLVLEESVYNNSDIEKISISSQEIQNLGYFDDSDTGIISVDIGGEFGRIDLEVNGCSDVLLSDILHNEKFSGLALDENLNPKYSDKRLYSFHSPLIVYKDDGPYLVLFQEYKSDKVKFGFSKPMGMGEIFTYSTFNTLGADAHRMYKISLTSNKYGKIV